MLHPYTGCYPYCVWSSKKWLLWPHVSCCPICKMALSSLDDYCSGMCNVYKCLIVAFVLETEYRADLSGQQQC